MVNCVVKLCRHYSLSPISKAARISFHSFPKDPARKRAWVEAIRREDKWIPTKHAHICSAHFTEACFLKTSKGTKRLVEEAIPTLNLYKEEIKQKSPEPSSREVLEIARLKYIINKQKSKIKLLTQNIRRKKNKINNLEKKVHDLKQKTSKKVLTETEAIYIVSGNSESKQLDKRNSKHPKLENKAEIQL